MQWRPRLRVTTRSLGPWSRSTWEKSSTGWAQWNSRCVCVCVESINISGCMYLSPVLQHIWFCFEFLLSIQPRENDGHSSSTTNHVQSQIRLGLLSSVQVCKIVFLCRHRTRWRMARLRSRPTSFSLWRTCRTPSVRWKNKPPPLAAFPVFISEPSTAESHSTSSYSPKPACSPVLLFLWVCVYARFHVEGKRERCTVFIINWCLISAYSGSSAWSLIVHAWVDLMCVWKRDLFAPFPPFCVYMISVCIRVALPEGDCSVDVL